MVATHATTIQYRLRVRDNSHLSAAIAASIPSLILAVICTAVPSTDFTVHSRRETHPDLWPRRTDPSVYTTALSFLA